MRSSKELKSLARESLAGNYGSMIGAYVLMSLVLTVALMPFSLTMDADNMVSVLIYYVAAMIISLISIIMTAGYLHMMMNLARGEKFSLGMLFAQFKHRPDRIIGSSLLLIVIEFVICIPIIIIAVAAGINIFAGNTTASTGFVAALIAVGILTCIVMIFVSLRLALYLFFLVDHPEMGAIESLKESSALTKGKVGHLLYVTLSFIPMMLLGLLSWGIGLLWVEPYYCQTLVYLYLDLTGDYDRRLEEEAAKHAEEPQYGPEYYA